MSNRFLRAMLLPALFWHLPPARSKPTKRNRPRPVKLAPEKLEDRLAPDASRAVPDILRPEMFSPPQQALQQAPAAAPTAETPRTLVVAVLDKRPNLNHPDFADVVFSKGFNFLNNAADVMGEPHDHGTAMVGVLAAQLRQLKVPGVTFQIMPLVVVGPDNKVDPHTVARALEYAVANGAAVSVLSFKVETTDPVLYEAIAAAGVQEHTVVAAAGNSGRGKSALWNALTRYDLPNLVTVAASDDTNGLASFSNSGHIAGPGVNVVSTAADGGYGLFTGTSVPTPAVAATIALVRGRYPEFSAVQAINHVLTTADLFPDGLQGNTRLLNAARAVGVPEPQGTGAALSATDPVTAASPVQDAGQRAELSEATGDLLGLGKKIKKAVKKVTSTITKAISVAASAVLKPVAPVLKAVNTVTAPLNKVLAPINKVVDKVLAPVNKVLAPVLQPLAKALAPIAQPLGQLSGALKTVSTALNFVAPGVGKVVSLASGAVSKVNTVVQTVANPSGSLASAVVSKVVSHVPGVSKATQVVEAAKGKVSTAISQDKDKVAGLFSNGTTKNSNTASPAPAKKHQPSHRHHANQEQ